MHAPKCIALPRVVNLGSTLSFLTANIMMPPALADGVFLTIDRVCSPCRRAAGLSMMGYQSRKYRHAARKRRANADVSTV